MHHLCTRAAMAQAMTLALDPCVRSLLAERLTLLSTADHDLTDDTEFLIVEPGDAEADIVRHVGFSPLTEPIEGARFGESGFHPFWDWLADHDGAFELIVTFGSTFAYVLLIMDVDGVLPELRAMCRRYAR